MEEDNCTIKAVVVDKHSSGNLTGFLKGTHLAPYRLIYKSL